MAIVPSGSKGISPWIGWGISTLLLLWMNRKNRSEGDTSSPQPSKFTEDTGNQIGNCIPVVMGRTILKNPLISFYGDYSWRPYTEEYGMHSELDLASWWLPILLMIIAAISTKDTIKIQSGTGVEDPSGAIASMATPGAGAASATGSPTSVSGLIVDAGIPVQAGEYAGQTVGPGVVTGTISYAGTGAKRAAMMNVVAFIIAWILAQLFNDHDGRTTIQKGFKYYLGWQNILCWTGDNFGLKRIWMNVYDGNIEQSTEVGVWGSDNTVWKQENQMGITARIDDENMFGGVDEGGGFIGNVHFYFGTPNQPFDDWMVYQMTTSENVPADLKGLTPRYPMFVTCVVNDKGGPHSSGEIIFDGGSNKSQSSDTRKPPTSGFGAYIGKQATVPEMWFEVVNYPSTLKDNCVEDLKRLYSVRAGELYDLVKMTADMEGVPEGAQGAYNQLQDVANNWNPDNLTHAIIATDDLLNALSPTTELYRRTQKLKNLLDHGLWKLGRIGDDCNPAEVICEILINSYWGCNYNASMDVIDVDSLLMLGAICEEEELGISCLITNTAQAYEYIDKILTHINGVKYDDPVTGKLTFKLIRGDYDISKLKVFTPTNCESLEFTRLDWSETSSSVSVNFTMADNKYVDAQLTYSDMANPLITGVYSEFNIDGTYFTTPKNARVMAQTQLLSAGYPLSAVNFVCNRYGYDVSIGDPIVVTWPMYGITKQIFRVTDIDYGTLLDGRITVTALEDVFGFDQTDYAFTPTPVWTDPEEDPQDVENYFFFEMPYELAWDLNTHVYAAASQPSLETVQWYVWRQMSGEYVMKNTSTRWSMMGRMVYGIDERYDDNDMVGFELSYIPNNGEHDLDEKMKTINELPYVYTNTSGLNLLECNGEIMSYSGIEKLANGNYRIYGLIRGIYDTVPKGHVSHDTVHFLDYGLDINAGQPIAYNGYTSHEKLAITTSSQTKQQEFDGDKVKVFDTQRRTECPSIMGNLQFSADRGVFSDFRYNFPTSTAFCHDINFKFKARNKFNNASIKGQGANSVDVPDVLKNVIRWKVGSDEYEVMFDAYDASIITTGTPSGTLEEMTLKWSTFCSKLGSKVRANNDVYMEIYTYNSSSKLYSYDHYEKQIIMIPPILVGIVENEADVQGYANSLCYDNTVMEIPQVVTVTSAFALTYEQAALVFIGQKASNGQFMSLDGNKYNISTTAFRIDGATQDPNNPNKYIASIHKIKIDEAYIFRTNFTGFYNNEEYYQRWMGQYNQYYIYTPPIQ